MTEPSVVDNADATGNNVPPLSDDDLSDSTNVAAVGLNENEQKMKEIVIAFDFQPKTSKEAELVGVAHAHLIDALLGNYDSSALRIYNNKGKRVKKINLVGKESNEHKRDFTVFKRQGSKKNKKPRYSIIHRIRTTETLSSLRNSHRVFEKLKEHNCYMRKHFWTEDVKDNKQICHILGINPENYTSDDSATMVTADIKKLNSNATVPQFRMVYSSPSITTEAGRFSTKAYSLEARADDVSEIKRLLKTTYKGTNRVLLAALRYSNEKAYSNGIRLQTKHIKRHYTIPIEETSPEVMTHLRDKILAVEHVCDIVSTKRTSRYGRYNIVVERSQFNEVKTVLNEIWGEILEAIPTEVMDDNKFGTPYLSIRDDESEGEMSFLSLSAQSLASLDLSDISDTFETFPPPSSVHNWSYAAAVAKKPPSEIEAKTTPPDQTPTSTGTSDLTSAHQEQLTSMQKSIDDLKKQLAASTRQNDQLPDFKQQLVESNRQIGLLLQLLPPMAQALAINVPSPTQTNVPPPASSPPSTTEKHTTEPVSTPRQEKRHDSKQTPSNIAPRNMDIDGSLNDSSILEPPPMTQVPSPDFHMDDI